MIMNKLLIKKVVKKNISWIMILHIPIWIYYLHLLSFRSGRPSVNEAWADRVSWHKGLVSFLLRTHTIGNVQCMLSYISLLQVTSFHLKQLKMHWMECLLLYVTYTIPFLYFSHSLQNSYNYPSKTIAIASFYVLNFVQAA